ncbi:8-oxoguanine deaminase [Anoxybacter fermentans]|uniref:8-oxoguanine deaminase n=1 Tax=Anoxybacter fermentans TaxID=1323375 RepID=A0A3Q9HQP0_9FIRM|nr:8-oxoguanine deaminase [Anoxybacter fermentans]AZR73603.1 8-oxoguanine deaminase [Anoxybacter fermentans]
MASLLIKNIKELITMDDQLRRFKNYSILIEDGIITEIAPEIDVEADEVIDAKDMWVFPGLINTHHHMYQTLTRNIPEVQDMELFDWLMILYPIWSRLTPEAVYTSTLLAGGELLKTGCTTTVDHFYVFPKDQPGTLIDEQIRAAKELGIRFHPCRGSMSRSKKDGGLPPDSVVQTPDEILKDCQRLIEKYHDNRVGSMLQIVLAPCSPFSVTTDLLKETIVLAREYGVHCHTHLCETKDEENYCLEIHGMRPLAYMESVDWIGPDVWYAHGIHFNNEELKLLAETKTGVAHCPVSNQKLASGVARVPEMLDMGIPVGLAVDGSASNDSSNMIAEMRAAFLLHRVIYGIKSMSAERALYLATRGSAQLLGRNDIGSIEVGKVGDLFMVNSNRLGFAGGQLDPVSALVHCGDTQIVDYTIVNGKIVVEKGKLVTVDEEKLIADANRISMQMIQG